MLKFLELRFRKEADVGNRDQCSQPGIGALGLIRFRRSKKGMPERTVAVSFIGIVQGLFLTPLHVLRTH